MGRQTLTVTGSPDYLLETMRQMKEAYGDMPLSTVMRCVSPATGSLTYREKPGRAVPPPSDASEGYRC